MIGIIQWLVTYVFKRYRMSYYDPYGKKSFNKVKELRPSGSKSAAKKPLGRVTTRSGVKPAPEASLKVLNNFSLIFKIQNIWNISYYSISG